MLKSVNTAWNANLIFFVIRNTVIPIFHLNPESWPDQLLFVTPLISSLHLLENGTLKAGVGK